MFQIHGTNNETKFQAASIEIIRKSVLKRNRGKEKKNISLVLKSQFTLFRVP